MANNSEQIAVRIREFRETLGLSPEDVARRLGISNDQYRLYENNTESMPISTLYKLAEVFETDLTVLLTGDSPRMADYTLVRAGQGVQVDRYPGYKFQSLAFNYISRTMEPMLVELEADRQEPALVTHSGQEFNWVVSGTVKVQIGTHEFILHEGDSCYFNPRIPHGQRAVGGPAKFITVIQR